MPWERRHPTRPEAGGAPALPGINILAVHMKESLSSGTIVSHYCIVSRLGAGGMGEVYLAEATKLARTVALKIIPADLATDPQRLRRFAQEAIVASALKHSNVAHIYEIEEAAGIRFIAIE